MLKLGEGGETGTDNQIIEHTFRRTGVSIMGKHMFDLGERMWPEEARSTGIGRDVSVELVETIASPHATHVRYAVPKP